MFIERTRILGGIQFTTHFIDFFVVETKRFVCSFVNVILTRQTCGQRSSRAAESKRPALADYFSERICYMLLISKCRGDRDLRLCTTSVLAFGDSMRSGDFRKRNVFRRRKNRVLPLRWGSDTLREMLYSLLTQHLKYSMTQHIKRCILCVGEY